jgi:hypothetical protein
VNKHHHLRFIHWYEILVPIGMLISKNLICAGVPLPVIQKIGGWKTMRSMLDTYTHIPQKDVDINVQKVLFSD